MAHGNTEHGAVKIQSNRITSGGHGQTIFTETGNIIHIGSDLKALPFGALVHLYGKVVHVELHESPIHIKGIRPIGLYRIHIRDHMIRINGSGCAHEREADINIRQFKEGIIRIAHRNSDVCRTETHHINGQIVESGIVSRKNSVGFKRRQLCCKCCGIAGKARR